MFKKFFFLFFLFFSISLFAFSVVNAFSISPVRYVLTVAPGEQKEVSLTIKNTNSDSASYNLFVLGASQNNSGQPIFDLNLSEAENWVKPEKEIINLTAKEEETVNFLINIPGDAYPGFYYLGLAVQERILTSDNIGLSGRLLTLLSLQVAGEAQEVLKINKWSPSSDDDRQWQAKIENKGNVDLPLVGQIVLQDWKKQEIFRQEIYLGNNLLPGTEREYFFDLKKNLRWSPWYWSELKIDYGRTGQTVSFVRWFGNLSVVGIVVLLVMVFLVYFLRHKKRVGKL